MSTRVSAYDNNKTVAFQPKEPQELTERTGITPLPSMLEQATSSRGHLFRELYYNKVIDEQGALTQEFASKPLPPLTKQMLPYLREAFSTIRSFSIQGKTVETTMDQMFKNLSVSSGSLLLENTVFTNEFVSYLIFSEEFGYLPAVFEAWGLSSIYTACIQGHQWVKKPSSITFRTHIAQTGKAILDADLGDLFQILMKQLSLDALPSQELFKEFNAGKMDDGIHTLFRILKFPTTPFRWMWEGKLRRPCLFNGDGFTLPITVLSNDSVSFSNQMEDAKQAIIDVLLGHLKTQRLSEFDSKGWNWLPLYRLQGQLSVEKTLDAQLFQQSFPPSSATDELIKKSLASLQNWSHASTLSDCEKWALFFNACCLLKEQFPKAEIRMPTIQLSDSSPLLVALAKLCQKNIPLDLIHHLLTLSVAVAISKGSTIATQSHHYFQTCTYQIALQEMVSIHWECDLEFALKRIAESDEEQKKILTVCTPEIKTILTELCKNTGKQTRPPRYPHAFAFRAMDLCGIPLPLFQCLGLLCAGDVESENKNVVLSTFLKRYPKVVLTLQDKTLLNMLQNEAEKLFGEALPCVDTTTSAFLNGWLRFLLKNREYFRGVEELLGTHLNEFSDHFDHAALLLDVPSLANVCPSVAKKLLLFAIQHAKEKASEEIFLTCIHSLAKLAENTQFTPSHSELFFELESIAEGFVTSKHLQHLKCDEQTLSTALHFLILKLIDCQRAGKALLFVEKADLSKTTTKLAFCARLNELITLQNREEAYAKLTYALEQKHLGFEEAFPYLVQLLEKQSPQQPKKDHPLIPLIELILTVLSEDSHRLLKGCPQKCLTLVLTLLERVPTLTRLINQHNDLTEITEQLFSIATTEADIKRLMQQVISHKISLSSSNSLGKIWLNALHTWPLDERKELLFWESVKWSQDESLHELMGEICSSLMQSGKTKKSPYDFMDTLLSLKISFSLKEKYGLPFLLNLIREIKEVKKRTAWFEQLYAWEINWKQPIAAELMQMCHQLIQEKRAEEVVSLLAASFLKDNQEDKLCLMCRLAVSILLSNVQEEKNQARKAQKLSLVDTCITTHLPFFLEHCEEAWIGLMYFYSELNNANALHDVWTRARSNNVFQSSQNMDLALAMLLHHLRPQPVRLYELLQLPACEAFLQSGELSNEKVLIFNTLLSDATTWLSTSQQTGAAIFELLKKYYETFRTKQLIAHPFRWTVKEGETADTLLQEFRLCFKATAYLRNGSNALQQLLLEQEAAILEPESAQLRYYLDLIDIEITNALLNKDQLRGTGFPRLVAFLSVPHTTKGWNKSGVLLNALLKLVDEIQKPENKSGQASFLSVLNQLLYHYWISPMRGLDYFAALNALLSKVRILAQENHTKIDVVFYAQMILIVGCESEKLVEIPGTWKIFKDVYELLLQMDYPTAKSQLEDLILTATTHFKLLIKNNPEAVCESSLYVFSAWKKELDFILRTDQQDLLTEQKIDNLFSSLNTSITGLYKHHQHSQFDRFIKIIIETLATFGQINQIKQSEYTHCLLNLWNALTLFTIQSQSGKRVTYRHLLSLEQQFHYKCILIRSLLEKAESRFFPLRHCSLLMMQTWVVELNNEIQKAFQQDAAKKQELIALLQRMEKIHFPDRMTESSINRI